MRKTKHWLMTIAALLCSMAVNAHDFEVGGIYYNITSSSDLTVAVTYRGSSYNLYSNEYSGAVTIPSTVTYNSRTYSVTWIGEYAFYCSSLTAITLPKGVTGIGDYAFNGCANLTSITLSEGVTSIGNHAFHSCTSLGSITLPKSITSIGNYAFCLCRSLTAITIPKSVTSIEERVFYTCDRLTSITLPEGVTSIGKEAFCDCANLTSITLPKSVTSIGRGAFSSCTSLASITLLEGVTSIGIEAFYYCPSLTSIILPKSVMSIGDRAFYNCSKLTAITCKAITPPTIKSYTFGVNKSIPVYVPAGSVAAYQSAEYWIDFTNIQPIVEPATENIIIAMNQYGSGTYCSEYALDFSEVEGLKAYAATGYNTKTGVVTLTRVMTSQPGMGLFLKGEAGEYTVPTLESTDDNSLNMLVGALENTELNGTSDDGLYYNYRYTIKEGDEAPKFYQVDDEFTLYASKAYLQIPVAWMPAQAKAIGLRFDDGGTTDIDELESESNGQNAELIYDLMGRRVTSPQRGMIYIVNGKKVVMD